MGADLHKRQWDDSYAHRDNFVFAPHEEVIRFLSKYVRKRVGLHEFANLAVGVEGAPILDLGCGIGRHVVFAHQMGLSAYGVDLSSVAVGVAREWASEAGIVEAERRILEGDVRSLPWGDGFFRYAVSHGVLDSMPFEVARAACVELVRVMVPGGLFYCDLISGDDSRHSREFAGAEIVETAHEKGTIQLYFNLALIRELIAGCFEIVECNLIRRENVLRGGYGSRYHLVLKRL